MSSESVSEERKGSSDFEAVPEVHEGLRAGVRIRSGQSGSRASYCCTLSLCCN